MNRSISGAEKEVIMEGGRGQGEGFSKEGKAG